MALKRAHAEGFYKHRRRHSSLGYRRANDVHSAYRSTSPRHKKPTETTVRETCSSPLPLCLELRHWSVRRQRFMHRQKKAGRPSMKTNILVSGLWYSGSSAVVDALALHPEVSEIPREFDDFRRFRLVGDLLEQESDHTGLHQLRRYVETNGSLQSFLELPRTNQSARGVLLERTVRSLMSVRSLLFDSRASRKAQKARLKSLLAFAEEAFSGSAPWPDRVELARKWIRTLQDIFSTNESHVLFDQPIMHDRHSETWPRVFSPFKLVVVVRNPLDQLTEIRNRDLMELDFRNSLTGSLHLLFGPGAQNAIFYQVRTLERRLQWVLKQMKDKPQPNFKVVLFEEFVTDHPAELDCLLHFLDLSPTKQGTLISERFNPQLSRQNVGLDHSWTRHVPEGSFDSIIEIWEEIRRLSR